ncbi:Putative diphthamide synthesis protein [Plasmodium yoelii yoelii]|uniref:2-(3-amino-3-carboxypropyl)histidine synthase subunit 1 n=1 Tax=Plasmodium yoelii yoelii TaxID=73239 RepID=Q7RPQ6_PLAYO|nr:Putative diphthamide synthesis protein [Plasmodium yoelii yoelii]
MNEISLRATKGEEKKVHCSIPKYILNNELLEKAIKKAFPENYNFEVYKCIDIIIREKHKNIASNNIRGCYIGGCCIDDFTSDKLKCDLIIHYGHSCLVPLTVTKIRCIYVFVDIKLNSSHLVETIKKNFKKTDIVLLLGTIQFSCVVHSVHNILKNENYFDTFLPIPQVLPLTKGEVLGCTSPNLYKFLYEQIIKKNENKLNDTKNYEQSGDLSSSTELKPIKVNIEQENESYIINMCRIFLKKNNNVKILFIADGRFHLESLMIHNPDFTFFRYNPFDKILSEEKYNYKLFYNIRKNEINKSKNCKSVCIILSTLGRQGNVNILKNLINIIKEKKVFYFILLLSEIFNQKLELIKNVDVFVQIGCPRLSIDWGNYNIKPLLNAYEAYVLLNSIKYREIYPMDYYSKVGNVWANYNAGLGDINEKNLPIKEIIKRRIQMKKSKISIHY